MSTISFQLVDATSVSPADVLPLAQSTGTRGAALSLIRTLFTAGSGVQIDQSGVISATAGSRVVTSGPSVTVSASDGLVVINKTTGSPTTVTLEANPAAGTQHQIKDGKGDAATNKITVTPASGTIDGAASFVINQNRGGVSLLYSGQEWIIT